MGKNVQVSRVLVINSTAKDCILREFVSANYANSTYSVLKLLNPQSRCWLKHGVHHHEVSETPLEVQVKS
jgi:hypothetical protein